MTALALVGLSVRALAEAAARDGLAAVAIDLFGDADTRSASSRWRCAGSPSTLRLDPDRVLAALHELAREGTVDGWVAGSGCECLPELVGQAAAVLPLIGTAPAAMRRARDPLVFFGLLASHGVVHPEVRSSAPDDPRGWLTKDALGCGGRHIRDAAARAGAPPAGHYFQRCVGGVPMSATFCADGRDAVIFGCNRLLVGEPGRPFAFRGAIGPVPLAEPAARSVERALRVLVAALSLQGLGSLDFMLDGDDVQVLEVNPRPPATLALYPGHGVMSAHVDACLHGRLPRLRGGDGTVHGFETFTTPRRLHLDADAISALRDRESCHDLPAAPTTFAANDPVCTVSASGDDVGRVRQRLQRHRDELLQSFERLS